MAINNLIPPDTPPAPDSVPEASANYPNGQEAVDMIRDKVSRLYSSEPDALAELAETKSAERLSRHQQYMYDISTSGKDLATVQTLWHDYYQSLSSDDKHQVWQEFYASQSSITGQADIAVKGQAQSLAEHKQQAAKSQRPSTSKQTNKFRDIRSKKEIQSAIKDSITAGGRLETKHHVQSLLFGLGMGAIVVVIFLFGFFNEVVIAPFIQPSRASAATPLIINSSSVAPTANPEVIIPKINVEIPADYTQTSTNEASIENALENGVVHYPSTTLPGQTGNAAFFGHSSNNIFNKGKYKFAFVLLHTLVNGDTFYLSYSGKVYVYKVISRTVVDPSEVGVLNPVPGQTATATLITCDPPGTSLRRLVVVGQQISPDPTGNTTAPTQTVKTSGPSKLTSEGPTLGGKFIRSIYGKAIIFSLLAGLAVLVYRKSAKVFASV
ncbi:MAG: hypothetical protein NVS1B10_00190 [Candidatus Saccharimonadales bacterium]